MSQFNRLQEFEITLIRFWDEDVYDDIDQVLRVIELTVLSQKEKPRL